MRRLYATCMSCRFYGTWLEWLVNWFRERFSGSRGYKRHRVFTCRRDWLPRPAITKCCRYYRFYKKEVRRGKNKD